MTDWLASLRTGLVTARAQWRMVLLVWATFLGLAWVAALPAWRWWDRLLAYAPEGDRLLDGLNLPLLHELFQYDRSPTTAIAIGSAWTFFLIALAINPFMAGGVLGSLQMHGPDDPPNESQSDSHSESPIASPIDSQGASPRVSQRTGAPTATRRFVNDGVRYYWRFARVLLTVGTLGMMTALFLMLALVGGAAELDTRGSERASLWLGDAALIVALLTFGLTSLIVDLARIQIVRTGEPRAVIGIALALRFLRHHLGGIIAISVAFLVLAGVAVAVYATVSSRATPRAWPLILLMMAWQQLFSLARTALRIGMLGALATLVDRRSPVLVLTPLPASQPELSELPPLG